MIVTTSFVFVESKTTAKQLEGRLNILKQQKDQQDLDTKKKIDTQQQEIDKLKVDVQARADRKASLAYVPVATASQQQNVVSVAPSESEQWYKMFIYGKESGNTPTAVNKYSGACGLGQALPCSKLPCLSTDYACQDNWFTLSYMIPRYGTWQNAYNFWIIHKWW